MELNSSASMCTASELEPPQEVSWQAQVGKAEAKEATDVVALSLLKQLEQDEEGHVKAKAGRTQ